MAFTRRLLNNLDPEVAADPDRAWFAARFHLSRLLLTDPNNPDLLRRRDEAEAHLKAP